TETRGAASAAGAAAAARRMVARARTQPSVREPNQTAAAAIGVTTAKVRRSAKRRGSSASIAARPTASETHVPRLDVKEIVSVKTTRQAAERARFHSGMAWAANATASSAPIAATSASAFE